MMTRTWRNRAKSLRDLSTRQILSNWSHTGLLVTPASTTISGIRDNTVTTKSKTFQAFFQKRKKLDSHIRRISKMKTSKMNQAATSRVSFSGSNRVFADSSNSGCYFYFFGCLESSLGHVGSTQASQHRGFSLVVVRGWVWSCRWVYLPLSMWDLRLRPGTEPMFPVLEGRSLTYWITRKVLLLVLKLSLSILSKIDFIPQTESKLNPL